MDITSVVGSVLAAALVISGIGLDRIGNFIDGPSLIIVCGCTFAALVISYPLEMLKQIPKHIQIMFKNSPYEPIEYVNQLEEMATLARKSGLLSLEEKAQEITDPFMKDGVMLIVDATAPEKVKEYLETNLENTDARHSTVKGMYSKGAEYAPAMGMVGTLMGLINMLMGLDLTAGPGNLTADMGVAMITTFYGSAVANLMFMPMANKLGLKNDDEIICKMIIVEGILAIQEGENPKFLRDKLLAFLSEEQKNAGSGDAGGGDAAE